MNGTINVIDRGEVRVHSYMAPEASVRVTTQIIETRSRLTIVDAQFLAAYADEAREYARSLEKPIERVIITHAHPDHYAAADRWGAPIAALPEVRDAIAARGDVLDPTGRVIQVADVLPTHTLVPGDEEIDGIPFRLQHRVGGEAHDQLTIALPEQKILIAQDAVYNQVHLYFGENDISGWKRIVDELDDGEYDVILAGHGLPASPAVFDEMRLYLDRARLLLGADGDAYKSAIAMEYPTYAGLLVIDIANRYLFGSTGH
jgi:glyoxylase-like metal-dependent hydrolase (beta-lactamase superfamily II)